MELWTRRKFFVSSVVGGALAGAGRLFGRGLEEGTIYRARTGEAVSGAVAGGSRPVMMAGSVLPGMARRASRPFQATVPTPADRIATGACGTS